MKTLFLIAIVSLFHSNEIINYSLVNTEIKAEAKFEIKKNDGFQGKSLEPLYSIAYINEAGKRFRFFEIIKTDNKLKDYFPAEFVLIEMVNGSQKNYFPLGWETTKITEVDIKKDCQGIINGTIKPIDIGS